MRRMLIWLVLIALVGGAVWFVFRDGGLADEVTEERVRTVLLDNGVPQSMADCMSPRLVDRLSVTQLRKLERLGAAEGESRIPLSTGEALARLRRVDDRAAVETLVATAGGCGVDLMLQRV